MEACLQGLVYLPACPELRLLFLDRETGGKEAPLAETHVSRKLPAVPVHDAVKLGWREGTLAGNGAQVLDYVMYQLFHGSAL